MRHSAPDVREPLLVVLLGPTASGKTSLSMSLAEEFNGEIVSCDSVAVYRGLEIGTAKPTCEQQSRITHHLIDVVSPNELYAAGDYSRAARAAIAGIARRGKLPILAGGSGLYARAALSGLFAGPQRSNTLRARLRLKAETRGPVYVHRILSRLDPVSAERIHANDLPKTIRAIEVSIATRRPMSEAWKTGRNPLTGYRILRLGLDPDRDELYARINDRARRMFERGLIEETKLLLARYGKSTSGSGSASPAEDAAPAAPGSLGASGSLGSLGSLGYRQAVEYIRGTLTLDQAIAAASQGHRNYAKRQLTWFRREPGIIWLRGFGDEPTIHQRAAALIEENLRGKQN